MSARNYRATVSNGGGDVKTGGWGVPIDQRNPEHFKALLQNEDGERWEEIK
jgi:hypothetical protein